MFFEEKNINSVFCLHVEMKKNRILVIGGDSFIASKFIAKNKDVFDIKVISRKETNFVYEIVLDDFFKVDKSSFKNIDVVINFAAIVHQPKVKDDELYNRINCELPVFLAKKAKENGVVHFIQMSTIAVYGNVVNINKETIEAPINSYGISKLNADNALRKIASDSFVITCIRPPMVYGGGNAPGNMMRLINFSQKKIFLPFKNINNQRDFINVHNLIDCFNSIIDNRLAGVLLPTDKHAISTKEIVELVCKHAKVKSRLVNLPSFFSVILKWLQPTIYNKVFGSLRVECNINEEFYSPKYTVSDGISEMIVNCKKAPLA
ncbi:NAD-dependent epimerase/dehydratase family protein [Ancylomarina sp. 16SWW S1-10-2]|uniref:NAD-dependent epimerase/dehydratase family protein n=1 Tax=Ancylomarina sp. 16SWW S1-10-2 TaxID=2499681 RepID=UPI0012AD69AE|nr:NAD-dependent epimerase/dehydratase family protein [Ancylomarina sp. 16SWW S1-10-2]MRT94802.1 NAD-dependent epimerase/dehydratase family protein [Ancylomarina sp. 16SWW S1-10-2]